jgi:iron complex outermembrane recepter protein
MSRGLGIVAAVTAAQMLGLSGIGFTSRAQTANPPLAVANTNPPGSPASPDNGNQLEKMTVTGRLIPRVGDGPQPVTSYDRDYIQKTGYQTVTDVLQDLPSAIGNSGPKTTAGFSFSPGSASIGLKALPPNDTLVLVDGLRYPQYPFPRLIPPQ